ncbi:MAG: DUF86 domain-containing protein [Anaerolineales bacterium]|nr:DUF86 domain-containing protein [Anaerolineales bacterium]
MTIKVEIILGLLESLGKYARQLKEMRPTSLRQLADDTLRYWAVLHGLQITVQHLVDIGEHILTSQNLAVPETYKDIIIELGRNKIIPYEFAERIKGMAGLRNVIVHRYLSVDPDLIWNILTNHLDDFKTFSVYIYDYLEREGLLGEK